LSGGADAGLFNINSATGVVSFKTTETYAATKDNGANHVYDFTISATDTAGNASTQAVALTMNSSSSIAVYYDAAHTQSAGNLIAPVQVDGGKLYYYWDKSGDGTSAGADTVTHDFLDGIFNKDVNGNLNPAGSTADTTNVYRYGTLYTSTGSPVQVALPTKGDGATGSYSASGTSVGGSPASAGSNGVNSTYDDLLAIWDAYNGTGTGTGSSGVPVGWFGYGTNYWSATQPRAFVHAYVSLYGGTVGDNSGDSFGYHVALQVL
jgi:hypothetical protein